MRLFILFTLGLFLLSEGACSQANSSAMKKAHVIITTELGDISIHLYDESPLHKENFLKLVSEGFYDSTIFHRVIKGFMVQGGDPLSKDLSQRAMWGNGGPGYTIPAEISPALFHRRGALAAARLGDQGNPERRSSGSQFYMVQGNVYNEQQLLQMQAKIKSTPGMENFSFTKEAMQVYSTSGGAPWLDMQYSVFGEVISGMDVVDKIAELQAGASDKATRDIMIKAKIAE